MKETLHCASHVKIRWSPKQRSWGFTIWLDKVGFTKAQGFVTALFVSNASPFISRCITFSSAVIPALSFRRVRLQPRAFYPWKIQNNTSPREQNPQVKQGLLMGIWWGGGRIKLSDFNLPSSPCALWPLCMTITENKEWCLSEENSLPGDLGGCQITSSEWLLRGCRWSIGGNCPKQKEATLPKKCLGSFL